LIKSDSYQYGNIYCDTSYSRGGANHVDFEIFKYSKDLIEYMQTYNQLMVTCPHAITFNHLTSQPSTQLHVLPTQN